MSCFSRLNYIDIARGLGILTVIYSHSGGEKDLMSFIGGFFIPLFFILSGYTFRHDSGQSFAAFIMKRGRRLLLPYIIFGVFLMLAYHCISPSDFLGLAYSRYCLYPLGTPDNVFFLRGGSPPLWFLTSMFTASMAVWWLFKSGRRWPYVAALYVVLTFVLGCDIPGLGSVPILLPWSLDTAFLMALFMMIGRELARSSLLSCPVANATGTVAFLTGKSKIVWAILLVGYFLLCIVNGTPNLSVRIYARSFLLILVTGTIGSMLVMKLSQKLEHTFLKGILADIGRHSMVIFCIQMLLLRIQNQLLFDILHIPLNSFTLYATSIFKTIVAAIIGMYVSKALKRLMPSVF